MKNWHHTFKLVNIFIYGFKSTENCLLNFQTVPSWERIQALHRTELQTKIFLTNSTKGFDKKNYS